MPKASKETASHVEDTRGAGAQPVGGTRTLKMATTVSEIDTRPVTLRVAAAIEAAEADAWDDIYAAAPAGWAEGVGIDAHRVGGALVLSWGATGRRYFSRVIGLGVTEPASEAAIDRILDGYERAGIGKFLLQSLPHCRPARYEEWLRERGLEPFDQQDRIIRDGSSLPGARSAKRSDGRARHARDGRGVVDLPAGGLPAGGRPLASAADRPAGLAPVRRASRRPYRRRARHVHRARRCRLAWDGRTGSRRDHERLRARCRALRVHRRRRRSARRRGFLADIEAPSRAFDTPAYTHFARLGFRRPYVRTHYARL